MLENISSPENPIISKMSNAMTDRSATEIKTNRLLNEIIESLGENKKASLFHCSVHSLLQIAEETEKYAKHYENIKNLKLNKLVFKNHGESFTQNLLRCVSKLFYDKKSGDPCFSQHFLDMSGISHIPITKFIGNRSNTYFNNAAGTFSIQHLYKYLTSSKIRPNILQNSIIHYIRNPDILSICQAFGLLDTKKPEKPELVHKIFDQTETTIRDTVLEAVQLISNKLLIKSKKLFGDFLNGSKFSNPSEEITQNSKSCSDNNFTLERLMAQIDRQKTIAPNTSISLINSKSMFKNNRTADWSKEKPEEQKHSLIAKCRRMREEKQ
ncbi:unnamed protein product [Mytilus coruscus]|uniref:Uncharacterized protein n=1 Tax=Mytilus coruscus TaxID=42192 RepID=A0A6J8E520_MYTCO|nr:unnamed protein product [Mytilus coruscus]